MNARRFGPKLAVDGVTFRLWAPSAKRVDLMLDGLRPMVHGDNGWFRLSVGVISVAEIEALMPRLKSAVEALASAVPN